MKCWPRPFGRVNKVEIYGPYLTVTQSQKLILTIKLTHILHHNINTDLNLK